jgi:hypothetical protein
VFSVSSCDLLQHGDHGNQHETADQTELFARAIQRHHAIGPVSAQKGFSVARRVKTPRIPAPKRRGLNPAVDVINRRAWEAMGYREWSHERPRSPGERRWVPRFQSPGQGNAVMEPQHYHAPAVGAFLGKLIELVAQRLLVRCAFQPSNGKERTSFTLKV